MIAVTMGPSIDWAAFFNGLGDLSVRLGKWVVPAILGAYVLGKLLDALKAKWSK